MRPKRPCCARSTMRSARRNGWRDASSTELTRAYDTLVITGGLMAGLAEQNDPAMRGMARDMADSTLRAFGLTP